MVRAGFIKPQTKLKSKEENPASGKICMAAGSNAAWAGATAEEGVVRFYC
jgi:hypothetical protein